MKRNFILQTIRLRFIVFNIFTHPKLSQEPILNCTRVAVCDFWMEQSIKWRCRERKDFGKSRFVYSSSWEIITWFLYLYCCNKRFKCPKNKSDTMGYSIHSAFGTWAVFVLYVIYNAPSHLLTNHSMGTGKILPGPLSW